MRRETAMAIEGLLARFPSDPPDAVSVRARVQRYVSECGCAAGGIFLVLAVPAALAALIVTDSWRLPVVLWSLFAVGSAPVAGKLTGIAVAMLRLRLLRRRLQRRVLALEVTDVHLH